MKLKSIALAALLMCSYFAFTQNVTTATNGLSKPDASTVSLGGTLTQHTDIDLGGSFNFGFKKGSSNYLGILNNGNVGLGVATPLAQFHTSGTLRLDMFKNNTVQDSILTTDINGNLIFKSIASYFRSNGDQFYIRNIGNTDSVIAEMGIDEETQQKMFGVTSWGQVDFGQGAQDVTNKFKVTSYGVGATHTFGNGNIVSAGSSAWGFEAVGYSETLYPGGRTTIAMQSGNVGMGLETMSDPGNSANIDVFRRQDNGLLQTRLYAENSGKGNMFTIDSSGFLFQRHNNSSYTPSGTFLSFKIKQNGKMVLDRYRNNISGDSVLTTDTAGNLAFKSLSSSVNAYNGLTSDSLGIKLGGLLTETETTLDGQTSNSLILSNLNAFNVYGNDATLSGTTSVGLYSGGASFGVSDGGLGGNSGPNGGVGFISGLNKRISLASQVDVGYGFTPINFELWLDTAGLALTQTSLTGGEQQYFRFGLDGRAYFPRYADGSFFGSGFNDAPTRKALYVDSATGKILYGDVLQSDAPSYIFTNGLTKSNDTVSLGGYANEINLGAKFVSLTVHDSASLNGTGTLFMFPGGAELAGYNNLFGEIRTNLEVTHNFAKIESRSIADNFGNAMEISTGGLFYGKTKDGPEGWGMNRTWLNINNEGRFKLGAYRNNETEDSVLTTDVSGNVKLKAVSSFSDFSYTQGDYTSGISLKDIINATDEPIVHLSVKNLAETHSSLFHLDTAGLYFNLKTDPEGDVTTLSLRRDNTELFSKNIHLYNGNTGLNINDNIEANAGLGNILLTTPSINKKITLSSNIGFENAFGTDIFYELGLDSAGMVLRTKNVFNGEKEHFRFGNDGKAFFNNYKNNGLEDSVLTTDSTGKLKLRSLTSSLTVANGLQIDSGKVKLGGILRDPTTSIEGVPGAVLSIMVPSTSIGGDYLTLNANNMYVGTSSSFLQFNGNSMTANGGSLMLRNNAMFGDSTSFKISIAQGGYPAYNVTDFETKLDAGGMTIRTTSLNEPTAELFRFDPDGRAHFNKYTTFGDEPTRKALYIDSVTGQIKYGEVIGSGGGGGSDDSKWILDDSGHIYSNNIGNVGIGTIPTAKFHTLGSIRFESFKNNLQADSVLTTDTAGNLKFVYMPYGSGGGSGANYTFLNGVTHSNGKVSLGGLLTDSVNVDLAGFPMSFNIGANKVWHTAAGGNIGIGTRASDDYKLSVNGDVTIGNRYDSAGFGQRLSFNAYSNTDGLYLQRYSAGPDASELRMNIGDDGGSTDKFHIGYYAWDNPSVWHTTFIAQANGQVGIGTADITSDLSIGNGHGNKISIGNSEWAKTSIITTGWDTDNADYTDLMVPGAENNTAYIRLNKAGNVGIGTLVPDAQYKLSVNGKIRAKGLRVQSSGWADFVFEPDYKLLSLPELEKFIKTYRHLPGIPTATDVKKEGQDVGETQAKLLQKVEELTLYIIELNKQVKELEDKNNKLEGQQTQIGQLQQQMEELKKMIQQKNK